MSKVVVIGFDHAILDKRIVLKDLVSLSKRFKEVSFITKFHEDDEKDLKKFRELLPNVELIRVKKEKKGIKARYLFEKKFYSVTLEKKPDIIYVHGSFLFFPFALIKFKKHLPQSVIISDIHEFEPDFFMEKKFILSAVVYNFYKIVYSMNSKVTQETFCATPHIKNFLEKYGYKNVSLKMNMSTTIPQQNYSYLEKLELKKFIVTGGIFRDRGIHYVIEIVSQVNQLLNEKFTIELYGKFYDKEYEQECILLAKELNVTFIDHGFLFYGELLDKMQQSTFVFHDLEKPLTIQGKYALSNKIFDATACGTPLVCQDNEFGIKSLNLDYDISAEIDINNNYPKKAAKGIIASLNDVDKYAQLCNNSLQFARENNWEKYEEYFLKKFEV